MSVPAAPTPLPADERRPPPLWRNLNFQVMWTSSAASGFADRLIELAAMPMLGVIGANAQAASIGSAVYFWYFLPWLFITPLGGWLADTSPRKWVMFTCDQGRALILLAAVFMVPAGLAIKGHGAAGLQLPPDRYWEVYLILAGIGAFAAVFSATKTALIPQIVPIRQLNPANAVVLSVGTIFSLGGYIVGNWLFEEHSLRAGLVVAMLAFAVSGLLFIILQPRTPAHTHTDRGENQLARMLGALTYLRGHRAVRRLVLLNALFWSMAMLMVAAVAALAKQRYTPPGGGDYLGRYSTLMALFGAGMLASAVIVAWINARREASIILLFNILLSSACILGMALSHTYRGGLALSFLIGFFGGGTLVTLSSILQALTPNYILGRVSGLREVISNVLAVGINLVIWLVPDVDHLIIASLYPTALVLAAVGAWGVWSELARGPLPNRMANVLWRLCRFYVLLWHRLRWVGRDRVPASGPVILAANHTTGLDPFLIQSACLRLVRWVMLDAYRYRAADVLWNAIDPIALTEDSSDLTKLREVLRVLKAGQVVGLFPEGELQREHRNLGPFQPGTAMLAKRSGATIVPVWIEGTPRTKRMLWHFLRPSRSTVTFGRPYQPDPEADYAAIAADLRARMLALARESAPPEAPASSLSAST